MIEFVYDLYLLYNNELIDNPTPTSSYIAEPGLVTKKEKLTKTSLYLILCPDKTPFCLLGLIFKNAPSDV